MAASTSAQDSVANFRRQAALVGLDNKWTDALVNHGVDTLGRLAFAVTSPGVPADDAGVTNLLNAALPAEPVSIADLTTLKRMIFEAQTALIGSIRAQADPAADPLQRKLPPAERALRITNQKARLNGIRLEGSMEVGHTVYDAIAGMAEADSLRYMAPSKAITRMRDHQHQACQGTQAGQQWFWHCGERCADGEGLRDQHVGCARSHDP